MITLFFSNTDQPEFSLHPKNKTKTEGDNVTFTCNATGNPSPTFRWTKNSSVLTAGSRISFSSDSKQLTMTNVIRGDSGQYVCEAINDVTTVQSNSATLNVQCKITFTRVPQHSLWVGMKSHAVGKVGLALVFISSSNLCHLLMKKEERGFGGGRRAYPCWFLFSVIVIYFFYFLFYFFHYTLCLPLIFHNKMFSNVLGNVT